MVDDFSPAGCMALVLLAGIALALAGLALCVIGVAPCDAAWMEVAE